MPAPIRTTMTPLKPATVLEMAEHRLTGMIARRAEHDDVLLVFQVYERMHADALDAERTRTRPSPLRAASPVADDLCDLLTAIA